LQRMELTQEKRVGVIVCGGKVDPGRFASSV
jgi:threonine dehydratase